MEFLRRMLEKRAGAAGAGNEDSVLLRDVPANGEFFSKDRTNLLVQRVRGQLPWLICVDADLEYLGRDARMARVFASGCERNGWRVLYPGGPSREDVRESIEDAFALLGSGGRTPALPGAHRRHEQAGGLLAAFGTDLTRDVRSGAAPACIGRGETVEEVVSFALLWQRRLPVITGPSGVGKTNLLYAVARRLARIRPVLCVRRVDLAKLMAGTLFEGEREKLLVAVLEEAVAAPEVVAALENVEQAVGAIPRGHLLLSGALEAGARIIATAMRRNLRGFEKPALFRRLHFVELAEPCAEHAREILESCLPGIARHHGVRIDSGVAGEALDRSLSLAGCLPAKAIALLDAAAARAVLRGAPELRREDVFIAASRFRER